MSDHGDEDTGRETPREEFHDAPIEHVSVNAGMTVGEFATALGDAGVGAGRLSEAVDLSAEMVGREDTTVFLGLAGAMVPTGMRRVVTDLVRDGFVDALVTTGATLTHDAIEAIGGHHHHGRVDPSEPHPTGDGATDTATERDHDERLREEGVDRVYDVYLPQEQFARLETHLRSHVFPRVERRVSIREFTTALGEANAEQNDATDVDADPGIAAAAAAADVPVYAPAIQDSVLGIQAWVYSQTSEFGLDALADMTELSDLAADADRAGALVVGGGVPKNYVLQTMLAVPGAYDYGVQLTMDPPHTAGLSGATLDEARSWGKLEPDAENVTVVADATITLPFLVAAVRERLAVVD
ncbi:MAG: deoxyhypusine synthase [uncultured archaeon A07HB70]|nr:MAG: deoxyhypusine synthase [uncultured archaeon A07HB70]